jgi:rhodanese-related sulfurtransferase
VERKDVRTIVICSTGHRAAIGMMVYQLLGFRYVQSLEGGLKAWNAK